MEVTLNDVELQCILNCVRSLLKINVMYESYLHPGKDKTEILELINLLHRIETKLEAIER